MVDYKYLLRFYFYFVYITKVCLGGGSACVPLHMHAGAHGGEKWTYDPLEFMCVAQ